MQLALPELQQTKRGKRQQHVLQSDDLTGKQRQLKSKARNEEQIVGVDASGFGGFCRGGDNSLRGAPFDVAHGGSAPTKAAVDAARAARPHEGPRRGRVLRDPRVSITGTQRAEERDLAEMRKLHLATGGSQQHSMATLLVKSLISQSSQFQGTRQGQPP